MSNLLEIIDGSQDTKLGRFTEEELDVVSKKLKAVKLQDSTKYSRKYGRLENLTTFVFDYATLRINKTQNFPWKNNFGIIKNHRGISLTALSAKVYYTLRLNRIRLKIENVLRKIQNDFWRNRSKISHILTIR